MKQAYFKPDSFKLERERKWVENLLCNFPSPPPFDRHRLFPMFLNVQHIVRAVLQNSQSSTKIILIAAWTAAKHTSEKCRKIINCWMKYRHCLHTTDFYTSSSSALLHSLTLHCNLFIYSLCAIQIEKRTNQPRIPLSIDCQSEK